MQGTDWTLSGTSGFNNASIDSGILRVTGSLNSPLTIGPGGALGGNGAIGGAVVNNGEISPGAGIATLNLGSTYSQAPNTRSTMSTSNRAAAATCWILRGRRR